MKVVQFMSPGENQRLKEQWRQEEWRARSIGDSCRVLERPTHNWRNVVRCYRQILQNAINESNYPVNERHSNGSIIQIMYFISKIWV